MFMQGGEGVKANIFNNSIKREASVAPLTSTSASAQGLEIGKDD